MKHMVILMMIMTSISISLFSPNQIDQSSSRILTTHVKYRPILHDEWLIKLGENRPDRVLKHLAAMLKQACFERLI